MKALDFLKSLLPNFAKQTVLDDIRTNRVLMTAVVMPAYQDALKVFGSHRFVNESLQKDWDVYRKNVKGTVGNNTVVAIEKTFKNIISTLDLIETLVEKDYNDDIEGAGVTYYKAAVLQMLESVGFSIDYAIKYLNYVYVVEAAEITGEEESSLVEEINASIVPAEVRFIHDRFIDFCTVMDTLTKPVEKLKTEFEEIPDITITQSGDQAVSHSIGATKLDPFRHGFVPLWMNPIYHVRMRIADYQHHRYEKAKAEKEVLELRKLRLERLRQGKQDAALDRQIEYTQKRIDDLAAQIRKVEEPHA